MPIKTKASTRDIIKFIGKMGMVNFQALAIKFNMADKTANNKLTKLKKQHLVINMLRGEWQLTEYGSRRLEYYGRKEKESEE